MQKDNSKWFYFLMSIGSVFILLSSTEDGSIEHLLLGLILIIISIVLLIKKSR